jgi:hypothetical protein
MTEELKISTRELEILFDVRFGFTIEYVEDGKIVWKLFRKRSAYCFAPPKKQIVHRRDAGENWYLKVESITTMGINFNVQMAILNLFFQPQFKWFVVRMHLFQILKETLETDISVEMKISRFVMSKDDVLFHEEQQKYIPFLLEAKRQLLIIYRPVDIVSITMLYL